MVPVVADRGCEAAGDREEDQPVAGGQAEAQTGEAERAEGWVLLRGLGGCGYWG